LGSRRILNSNKNNDNNDIATPRGDGDFKMSTKQRQADWMLEDLVKDDAEALPPDAR